MIFKFIKIIILLYYYSILYLLMADIITSDFEYSNGEQLNIIISNVLKMLENRKLLTNITKFNIDDIVKHIKKNVFYDLKLDKQDRDGKNMYKICIIDENIDKITGNTTTASYIAKYPNDHKIIILNSITKNIELQTLTYKFTEIFDRTYFMINIADFEYMPQHILLTDEEKEQTKKEYGVQLNKYPKIMITDPMSKYFNARLHDLFKIIRPSSVSGETISYRYVING